MAEGYRKKKKEKKKEKKIDSFNGSRIPTIQKHRNRREREGGRERERERGGEGGKEGESIITTTER